MKKTYSLRKRLLFLLTVFFAGVLIISIVNAATAFRGQIQTQKVYELFTVYNDYDDAVEDLQDAVVDYFIHGTTKRKAAVQKKAEKLNEMSGQMQQLADQSCNEIYRKNKKESDCYVFYDLCNVSKAYADQAVAYVEQKEETDIQDITHMSEMTLLLYDMLQGHVENIVNGSILLSKKMWQFQIWAVMIIFLAMLLYMIYIIYHLSHQVVHPIVTLTEKIQDFHRVKGQKAEKLSVTTCYQELMILYQEYSEMTETIENQIVELEDKARISEELRKKETALAKVEFSLMQSLLSPHFLYNCLSTISSLATIEHARRTYQGSVMIAKFLREALNNVGQSITVWEEINYTQHYIEIQKLRFGDTIHFTVSCDPKCARVKVPAILLQPLIENSISHGVKTMSHGGKIRTEVKMLSDGIEFCVRDNGSGISTEKQQELKTLLESDYAPDTRGVGLRSVAYRLRDIYGKNARIEIESEKGNTAVHLYICGEKITVPEDSMGQEENMEQKQG